MKKRIVQFVLFVLLLFFADRIIGLALKMFYVKTNFIEIAKTRYSLNSTSQDVLIFGSSRAQHHYIPDIIAQKTGLSCYNCGLGGQGLTFSYIQIHETLERYKPKLIILDLSPNLFFDPFSDQKLKIFLPYYSKDTLIRNTLTKGSPFETYKFLSAIYPYNSTIYNILIAILNNHKFNTSGYVPLSGTLDTTALTQYTHNNTQIQLPIKDARIILKIIAECKINKVNLMFIVSPAYRKSELDYQIIKQLATLSASNDIPFVDFSEIDIIRYHKEFFRDNLHLNNTGAIIFSNEIAVYLQKAEKDILKLPLKVRTEIR